MKLSPYALGITSAIICGAWCLVIGLLNVWFGYAIIYMRAVASLEPGVVTGTYGGVILSTVYGFVVAYVLGYLFGVIYNGFAKK